MPTINRRWSSLLCACVIAVVSARAQGYSFQRAMPDPSDAGLKRSPSMAMSSSGELFFADPEAHLVRHYDASGKRRPDIASFPAFSGTITLQEPTCVFTSESGDLFIYDNKTGQVAVRYADGGGRTFGERGSALGQIDKVSDLCVDSRGYIYVLNGARNQVDIFTPQGEYLTWIAGASVPFSDPVSIAISPADELYVMERKGPVVYLFDVNGNLLSAHRNLTQQAHIDIPKPLDLDVLPNGDFCILDGSANRIVHFDKLGTMVGSYGTKGLFVKGSFTEVSMLACGRGSDADVAIFDPNHGAAQVVRVETRSPRLRPQQRRMQLVEQLPSRPPMADIATASNGTRYLIPATDRTQVICYRDSSQRDAIVIEGQLQEAVALATDSRNYVYVVDRKADEVLVFDTNGAFVRRFGKEIPEKLKDPVSIAIQHSGNIIVADRSGSLHMWDGNGTYQKRIVSPDRSRMQSPIRVQVDGKDQIYVWDEGDNEILRIGATGWPIAPKTLQPRGEKPGSKAGEIGGFLVDGLDQIHLFNRTTSQVEVYAWDLEPVLKFSSGRPGPGSNAMDRIDGLFMDQGNFHVFLPQDKGARQKEYQFLVKPQTPENSYTFDVADGRLVVSFNRVQSPVIVGYGLLTPGREGRDTLVYRTNTSMFTLNGATGKSPVLRRYKLVSLSRSDRSEPTAGFDDHYTYALELESAGRYDEALAAWQQVNDQMKRSERMTTTVASHVGATAAELARNGEVGKALQFARLAYGMSPDELSVRSSYGIVLSEFFNQLATRNDIDGIINESERLMLNASLRPIVLSAVDSLGLSLGRLPNERSIRQGIQLQKKLVDWEPSNPAYVGSLAVTTFALYNFRSISGAGGMELEVLLSEADKYAAQAVTGLRRTRQPYTHIHLSYLAILNAGGKFAEAEKQAITELTESSSLSPADVITYRMELARAYKGQERFELAVNEYRKIAEANPGDAQMQQYLADALIDARKYDEAKAIYQQLSLGDRTNARYIGQIGRIELLNGNYAEASFQLEKALRQDPSARDLYGPLADAYDGASNYRKAISNYAVAVQYESFLLAQAENRARSLYELTSIRSRLHRYMYKVGALNEVIGEFDEAVRAYNEWIVSDPSNPEAHYGLGTASLSAGLVYDAVNAFYSAARLDPSNEKYANAHSNALRLRDTKSRNEAPLTILDVHISDVYPSLYRNYSDVSLLPLGEVIIANNTANPITPTIKVFVKELMGQPTEVKAPALVGYSNTYVKLAGLFDERILKYTADEKFQAEVEVSYTSGGQPKSIRKAVTFTMHGRNAITWSDKRRLAAFVSPTTEVLMNYSSKADIIFMDEPTFGLNGSMLKAMQLYTLLDNSYFVYSPDPVQSFATVTTNTGILDHLQYPAETLRRKSGDCDDLVALYAALLENAGIRTAYIDVPGHVFMAFDAGIRPERIGSYGLTQRDVIIDGSTVWVPIETTLIGTSDFLVAWKNAADRYYRELTSGRFPQIVALEEARTVYIPSSYVPEGFDEQPPAGQAVKKEYSELVRSLRARLDRVILKEMESRYLMETGNVYVKNKYASLLARAGQPEEAERVLLEALDLSPENAPVLNNLGNIYLVRGDGENAVAYYERAAAADASDGDIRMNLCKAWLLKGDKARANQYFREAVELDDALESVYQDLKNQLK